MDIMDIRDHSTAPVPLLNTSHSYYILFGVGVGRVCAQVPGDVYEGQRLTCGSWFPSSTMWILKIEVIIRSCRQEPLPAAISPHPEVS